MSRGEVETFYKDGRWHNRIKGTDEVFGSADSQQAAIQKGRARAKADSVDLVVLTQNGQVQERISNVR